MLNGKLDNITFVMLFDLTNTANQVVTPGAMSVADCGAWKMLELSRNYLITG
jgi:hypothetical protein